METALAALAALFTLFASIALADAPVTKWQWGCEWQQAENGNYWSKVDGGCKHWVALGYDRHRDLLGQDVPGEDEANEPEAPAEKPAV